MKFVCSWRWFGPRDRITLRQIRQTDAEAVVTALHQVPVGEVWTAGAVDERRRMIEADGLTWAVAESLPVSEDVKRRTGDFHSHVDNYKTSLRNLADAGVTTVCYNFMPVLDWSRTDLDVGFRDGSRTSEFRLDAFAAFDLFVLERDGAAADYPPETAAAAENWFRSLDADGIRRLRETILYGLPGSMQTYTDDEFRRHLDLYRGVDRGRLQSNLRSFLEEVVPAAETCGVRLALHPDDPPWNLLGLPRIASTAGDLLDVVRMVDSPSNGITLCTGSLGAGRFNDLTDIAETLAPFVHFAHLRNVAADGRSNFREETLFDGDVDMVAVVRALAREGLRREESAGVPFGLPVRPDHGHQMLGDIGMENYPGYGLYGRMKNLAAIKGLTLGVTAMERERRAGSSRGA